jgi:hypothetical protein
VRNGEAGRDAGAVLDELGAWGHPVLAGGRGCPRTAMPCAAPASATSCNSRSSPGRDSPCTSCTAPAMRRALRS